MNKPEPKWKDEIVIPNGFYRGHKAILLQKKVCGCGYQYLCDIEGKVMVWLTDYDIGVA